MHATSFYWASISISNQFISNLYNLDSTKTVATASINSAAIARWKLSSFFSECCSYEIYVESLLFHFAIYPICRMLLSVIVTAVIVNSSILLDSTLPTRFLFFYFVMATSRLVVRTQAQRQTLIQTSLPFHFQYFIFLYILAPFHFHNTKCITYSQLFISFSSHENITSTQSVTCQCIQLRLYPLASSNVILFDLYIYEITFSYFSFSTTFRQSN